MTNEVPTNPEAYKNVSIGSTDAVVPSQTIHANAKLRRIGLARGSNHEDLAPWNHVTMVLRPTGVTIS